MPISMNSIGGGYIHTRGVSPTRDLHISYAFRPKVPSFRDEDCGARELIQINAPEFAAAILRFTHVKMEEKDAPHSHLDRHR